MNIIGLVAEYNPLHNGHIYQIKKIKEMFPDSVIVLVLNGYFLERGEISFLSKEDKVRYALDNGIDIVLELPVVFGCQAADVFSYQSIYLLNKLNIDTLVFGSESGDIKTIRKIGVMQQDSGYNKLVKDYLNKGLNYPTAMARALDIDFEFNPNDLLGISYLKAIDKINPRIKAVTIKRTSSYHDLESNSNIISASNIRNKFLNNVDVSPYTPYFARMINPNMNEYFKLLKSKILTDTKLDSYLDVTEGLDYRLKKVIRECNSLDELINKLKSKRYTYNKISRTLVHILLGITPEVNKYDSYLKVLGFSKEGSNYLKKLDIDFNLYKHHSLYKYELNSSMIYDLINNTDTYSYESKNKPVIKD
ncbi:uPF0348 protein FSAG_00712 [Coprobacillus sp. CAG:605]|nr:uPF0348 protein FSAG_00712 [Coprobacillus sp. CAG:605]